MKYIYIFSSKKLHDLSIIGLLDDPPIENIEEIKKEVDLDDIELVYQAIFDGNWGPNHPNNDLMSTYEFEVRSLISNDGFYEVYLKNFQSKLNKNLFKLSPQEAINIVSSKFKKKKIDFLNSNKTIKQHLEQINKDKLQEENKSKIIKQEWAKLVVIIKKQIQLIDNAYRLKFKDAILEIINWDEKNKDHFSFFAKLSGDKEIYSLERKEFIDKKLSAIVNFEGRTNCVTLPNCSNLQFLSGDNLVDSLLSNAKGYDDKQKDINEKCQSDISFRLFIDTYNLPLRHKYDLHLGDKIKILNISGYCPSCKKHITLPSAEIYVLFYRSNIGNENTFSNFSDGWQFSYPTSKADLNIFSK